jgi:hypothetical protein
MELIPLNCNNCGSKLRVDEDTKFVTCKHCDAQLAVRHEDGAAFTDVLEAAARVEESAAAIEEHVEKLGADNERLFLQGEVERLDREWEARQESFMIRGRDGHSKLPLHTSPGVMTAVAVLVLIPALIPTMMGVQTDLSWLIWLSCIAFSGISLLVFSSNNRRAAVYDEARAAHDAEREQLLAKLDDARPSFADSSLEEGEASATSPSRE